MGGIGGWPYDKRRRSVGIWGRHAQRLGHGSIPSACRAALDEAKRCGVWCVGSPARGTLLSVDYPWFSQCLRLLLLPVHVRRIGDREALLRQSPGIGIRRRRAGDQNNPRVRRHCRKKNIVQEDMHMHMHTRGGGRCRFVSSFSFSATHTLNTQKTLRKKNLLEKCALAGW